MRTYPPDYYQQNKEMCDKKQKKWRMKNPDKVKAMRQRTRLKRRFKFLANMANRNSDNKISAFDLFCLAKRQKLRCALTGDKLTNETISIDHIIPRSKGGKNTIENLRLVRKDINLALFTHTDEEFYFMCKSVVDYLKPKFEP